MRKKIVFYLFVCLFLFAVLFPFFWQFITSIKPPTELFGERAFSFYTTNPSLQSYINVFTDQKRPFLRYLWNSTVVASITTAFSLIIASFTAYAIARLHFRGKNILLGVILAVSMFPQIATIAPVYLFLQQFDQTNSYFGLILPYTTFALPLAVWNLTTYYKQIPLELEESAKVDGATAFQRFYRIIVPLVLPGTFTTAILVFIAAWNEFLFALTINTDELYKTIPVGIALFQGQFIIPWGDIAAASVIVTIPLVIMVLFFQRWIVAGLTSGAVKE
ncbi:carbohydrate ABC transporter permease [Shimazuella sp. AN120528]|uniref:carbohydrate ABC transporter permease n=1 Tax=Shimazuella soli TaxID=1892854 RepID=UPI001F10F308|nr:carbohydrate ABC transporter permease [Shimazuella soli]MCH5584547.1 carbohydrate ABC transporter permease [Shimazuella soli]